MNGLSLNYTNFKGPTSPKLSVRDYLMEIYYNYKMFKNVSVSEDFFANFAT